MKCQQEADCPNEATCIGAYEGSSSWSPSCDEHCGHGCEDGRCVRVDDAEGLAKALIQATALNEDVGDA
jgi:hypothetical protein